MKKILFIGFLTLAILSCKSQNIISIYNGKGVASGTYLKDKDNDFNKYVGTWKWQNKNNSLTIQFKKVIKYYNENPEYPLYNDYLIGGYQYTQNGNIKINSLPIIYNGEDPEIYSISGWNISTTNKGFPPCDECAPNTRFIILSFGEPDNPQLQGKMIMAYFLENGIEKIRARIVNTDITNLTADYTGPESLKVPEGIYTFVKM